ncbi:hypothetical protein [Streptomyces sp. SID8358]|uniref:hypothetical protein n=1 Tax=Streptomyces sp. SID8358 TaxID=2690342 RepID=UPI001F301569|nr:hypothetical protein [Streptomyces sp. SID8358]
MFRKGTSTGFLAPVNWRRSGSCTYDAAPKGRQHARDGLTSAASRASYSPTIGLEAFLEMPRSQVYGDSLTLDGVLESLVRHSTDGFAQLLHETGRSLLS